MRLTPEGRERLQELSDDWNKGWTSPLLAQSVLVEILWMVDERDIRDAVSMLPRELGAKIVEMSEDETHPELRRIVDTMSAAIAES